MACNMPCDALTLGKWMILASLAPAFCGCATTTEFERRMGRFVGQPHRDFQSLIGGYVPAGTKVFENGDVEHHYRIRMGSPGPCDIHWIVDQGGIARSYRYEGKGCRRAPLS